jgi:4-amino-4-deoxy-L-arabinose transferase-like glycosyltransferase
MIMKLSGRWREDSHQTVFVELLVLFGFALALRLSLLPYWMNLPLSGDELYYWSCARSVAHGQLIRTFLHPPLWGYLLGLPAAISDHNLSGRMLTTIIGSLSVPIIYLLGKQLFGRTVGVMAGVIYAVYPNIVGFSHYLWPESLLSLLVLVAALLFFKSMATEKRDTLLYLSFFTLSVGVLVKEFALIPFGAMIFTVLIANVKRKKQIIVRGLAIFIAPVIIYSIFASVLAKRPVLLADAFVFNSNEADAGKEIWKKSTKENLELFAGRLLELKKVPGRFIKQIPNLWTTTSFPIFRLLNSMEKYPDFRYAKMAAYLAAGAYVWVVAFGLVGICCAKKDAFLTFSAANLVFLTSAGALFLMCSRFRISFMYIFILYDSVLLSDFQAAIGRLTWRRMMILTALLVLFLAILIYKRSAFGHWG